MQKGRDWFDPDYLRDIDQLFCNERELPEGADRQAMREKDSLSLAEALFAKAHAAQGGLTPKTRLGQAVKYLLGQHPHLRRCLSEAPARLDNNPVENGPSARSRSAPRTGCSSATPTSSVHGWPISSP